MCMLSVIRSIQLSLQLRAFRGLLQVSTSHYLLALDLFVFSGLHFYTTLYPVGPAYNWHHSAKDVYIYT